MDLLVEIRGKSGALIGHPVLKSVQAVLRHVGIAERYLLRARSERDEDLYNDVIYRTNQAFEGVLKAAYTVLTTNSSAKLSPHQIEQHLLDTQVLSSRVLDLFRNYRQHWRNPSTHEHELFFNEQEALLAIVSVSAFVAVLLDQIIEKINYDREQQSLQTRTEDLQNVVSQGLPLHLEVVNLIIRFSGDLLASTPDPSQLREIELIGRLSGFIESFDPTIKSVREPLLDDQARPDLLLTRGDEQVVLEVKRPGFNSRALAIGRDQLYRYLEAGKLRHGILYIPPVATETVTSTCEKGTVGGMEIALHFVVPENPKRSAPNPGSQTDA